MNFLSKNYPYVLDVIENKNDKFLIDKKKMG